MGEVCISGGQEGAGRLPVPRGPVTPALHDVPRETSAAPEHRSSRTVSAQRARVARQGIPTRPGSKSDSPGETHKLPTQHLLVFSQRPEVTSVLGDFLDMSCLRQTFILQKEPG